MCVLCVCLTERQLGEAAWLSSQPGSVHTHTRARTHVFVQV